MLKGFAVFALLLFGGGYFLGAFGPQAYSRTVSRPPTEVMAALEHLDITAQPGAPGSTAAAAGGIKPLFRLARSADRMTWYVMSGDKVATTMTASFTPVDGGKATRISTAVERGDAPDDFVSPAFRSKGLTMALFGVAIEGEVNRLVAPPAASAETCRKLFEQFAAQNLAARGPEPQGFRQGMADGVKQVMRLNAMEPEMRRQGCNTNGDGSFHGVEQQMEPGEPSSDSGSTRSADRLPAGATTADRPMLDPTPPR